MGKGLPTASYGQAPHRSGIHGCVYFGDWLVLALSAEGLDNGTLELYAPRDVVS